MLLKEKYKDIMLIDIEIIKMRHDDVIVAMTSGGVDNMEKYQYMLGQRKSVSITGNIHPATKN